MGFAARFIIDGYQRFFKSGLTVYLRFKNFDDTGQDYADVGFEVSVTGALAASSGFTDIVIDPPPEVKEVSMHNIGIMGGQLSFGAKEFRISHTWVLGRMAAMGYTDPKQVFQDPKVVGIIYEQRLHMMVSLTHDDVGGETTLWKVITNATDKITT